MSQERKDGLQLTIICLTSYGITWDEIQAALEKAGKEIQKITGDYTMKLNNYPLKEEQT